jgi:DNA-binding transcriptional ArsR family regulator
MRDLVKVFRALSDETRIRILKVILERGCCVCLESHYSGIEIYMNR